MLKKNARPKGERREYDMEEVGDVLGKLLAIERGETA